MNLEEKMKNVFKVVIKGIMTYKGINPSKLTDAHFEALWKISKETSESEKSDKLQQYLKTYVL